MPPNKSLQQTLDPVATLAVAKPAPASIAAEHWRYTSGPPPFSMTLSDVFVGIEQDDPEAFLGGGELLRAHSIGLNGTAVIEPYQSMYRENPLSTEQVAELTQALKNYIAAGRMKNAASAAHALGERRDPALVLWLQTALSNAVQDPTHQGDLIGQLIVALGNCGDRVSTGISFSSDDYDKNLSDARAYLEARHADGHRDV